MTRLAFQSIRFQPSVVAEELSSSALPRPPNFALFSPLLLLFSVFSFISFLLLKAVGKWQVLGLFIHFFKESHVLLSSPVTVDV